MSKRVGVRYGRKRSYQVSRVSRRAHSRFNSSEALDELAPTWPFHTRTMLKRTLFHVNVRTLTPSLLSHTGRN